MKNSSKKTQLKISQTALLEEVKRLCREEGKTFVAVRRTASHTRNTTMPVESKAVLRAQELVRVEVELKRLEFLDPHEDYAPQDDQRNAKTSPDTDRVYSVPELFQQFVDEGLILKVPEFRDDHAGHPLLEDLKRLVDKVMERHNQGFDADAELNANECDEIRHQMEKYIEKRLGQDQGKLNSEVVQERIKEAVGERTTEMIRQCLELRGE